ncbi:hypothetical protein GQ43DRAFT_476198 [Delitschia confertaspora ATCC 74209]|uniref:Uncharacterized protein n=1 Tax=Delitschia confertaspora ATCC 74209 TaxID=1513339 RepID=A0A9P4ML18_9PLEO|nr:hypothetical protein GQ43DRAFT_476198 [Delitschia confertaspora ATCC 74209]
MGKKKRAYPDLQEKLDRPWCYYCERDFDDLKILISHQKAKHFRCDRCNRRLNTAGGLNVHMSQVHKEVLQAVENAIPGRQAVDVEIFGMEGVPEDALHQHTMKVTQEHFAEEQERAVRTGNPIRDPQQHAQGQGQSKRPKLESAEEMRKRLAEHRARKAAGESGATSSGNGTPLTAGPQSPATPFASTFASAASPVAYGPGYGGNQTSPPPVVSAYGQAPGLYGQAPVPYAPGQMAPGYGAPYQPQYPGANPSMPHGAGAASPPVPSYGQYTQGAPPIAPPSVSSFGQSAPGAPSTTAPPSAPGFGTSAYGSAAPHNGARAGPPGLPQRPQAGPIGAGGFRPGGHPMNDSGPAHVLQPSPSNEVNTSISASVDQLISDVTTAAPSAAEPVPEKKSKKERNVKLVYSDESESPEEKLAKLPKYAFVPDRRPETVLGDETGAVTGTVKQ